MGLEPLRLNVTNMCFVLTMTVDQPEPGGVCPDAE